MQNIAAMIAADKKLKTSVTLNEFEYTSTDFFSFYERFIKMDRKNRLDVSGLDPKRVDFIVAGAVLVNCLLRLTGIERIKTSTQAMREGIILRFIKKERNELSLLSRYPDTRRRSIFELLVKCNWHEQHSTHVSTLALKLFDELRPWHDLSDEDRELLEYAALTHDIGYHISHKKHHKHALYLITNADLKGFLQEEIEIIANVARYHRRSTPKARHNHFDVLNPTQKRRIRAIAGILRVADGLDRSHFQNVKNMEVEVTEQNITLTLDTIGDPELEIWGAMRKRELFEKLFNRTLVIK
jgi:exopolyphosphatase / guanosine-5'-triphosphate,3'-diphosphate pyrophosphatase